jgi:hypothetical protein
LLLLQQLKAGYRNSSSCLPFPAKISWLIHKFGYD